MALSYKLVENLSEVAVGARKIEDGQDDVCFLFCPENRDYQEYLAWLAEGNTPLPADD